MTVLVRIEPAVVPLCFRALTVTALVLGVLVIVR